MTCDRFSFVEMHRLVPHAMNAKIRIGKSSVDASRASCCQCLVSHGSRRLNQQAKWEETAVHMRRRRRYFVVTTNSRRGGRRVVNGLDMRHWPRRQCADMCSACGHYTCIGRIQQLSLPCAPSDGPSLHCSIFLYVPVSVPVVKWSTYIRTPVCLR